MLIITFFRSHFGQFVAYQEISSRSTRDHTIANLHRRQDSAYGYHLHFHSGRMALPGCCSGFVYPPYRRLGDVGPDDQWLDCERLEDDHRPNL